MNPDKTLFDFYLSEIKQLDKSIACIDEKFINLKNLLEQICGELVKEEKIQFSGLFSRIVYISQKYSLPKSLEWELQNIRVKASKLLRDSQISVNNEEYLSAVNYLYEFIKLISENIKSVLPENDYTGIPKIQREIPTRIRAQVTGIEKESEILLCRSDFFEDTLVVRYNIIGTNDHFNETINQIWIGAQLNLIDCSAEKDTGYFVPRYIVLEPDYLIDSSAISECFQNYGISYLHYFRRKFESSKNSKHILLGNLANFFLDEMVYAEQPEEQDFQTVYLKAFKNMPFEFTGCTDIKEKNDFLEFMRQAEKHFENIRRVVVEDFPENAINTQRCTLEPSFICERFGFQGRLDLLQLSENEKDNVHIIELKSGKLPFPKDDPGKIALNHEVQTAVYRMIIQSVFNKDSRNIIPLILYSSANNSGENLRMSAAYKTLEKEIVNIRNRIIAAEYRLYYEGEDAARDLMEKLLDTDSYGNVPQFFTDKLTSLGMPFRTLTELEKNYFFRFVSFLSRELYIQKTGGTNYDSFVSTANLWNTEFTERLQSHELISELEIVEITDGDKDMKISFKRNVSAEFVNFREGEICIVYPRESEKDSVLTNQILKGTIAEIKPNEICVRFRYKQKNKNFLYKYNRWVIEHDRIDHTFNAMYRGLFSFLQAPQIKRNKVLGMVPPEFEETADQKISDNYLPIDLKQKKVIDKALKAKDYFLIVGPPGTGKTSVFARKIIKNHHSSTEKNILVMAYTNRAVDELCEAVNSAFGCENGKCENYIRIGTELSCKPQFRHRLLQNIAGNVYSRKELREIIGKNRIFVGTIASITGKPEIFDLKKFDIAIIDEASQILEPQIVGLLAKVGKYILIGDDKQLSTITLQHPVHSIVNNPDLQNIELWDCRESYFERLFRLCIKNDWNHAYDILTYQGRMHEQIAGFTNRHFYNNKLLPINKRQTEPLSFQLPCNPNVYHRILSSSRIGFIPNNNTEDIYLNSKACEGEADIIVQLSLALVEIYKANGLTFNEKTLGIITPYRNQIALIRQKFESLNVPELKNIIIDTVERFQGSQKDVIFVSFCLNKPYQQEMFSNLNREKTVDRKLNVALTRARNQLFLTGNEKLLKQNKIYRDLIAHFGVFDLDN